MRSKPDVYHLLSGVGVATDSARSMPVGVPSCCAAASSREKDSGPSPPADLRPPPEVVTTCVGMRCGAHARCSSCGPPPAHVEHAWKEGESTSQ